ncbi:FtsX-like permease family protein [bacterium]|nr:FtsX-like permease family protein [bacterium]
MTDLKFAFRQLLKNKGFTAVAVLTLALGIGANTALFSVMDQLLVRPLPVANPDRLAILANQYGDGEPELYFNYPLFRDFQKRNTVFRQLSAIGNMAVGLGTGGVTDRQQAALVSGNYFAMLGVRAALGRTFADDEGAEIDDASVVVISHSLWQSRFGADPTVIGRKVTLNGQPFEIIGVSPREFSGVIRGTQPDLYIPITTFGLLNPDRPGGEHPLRTRYFTWHRAMGRLKDGVSLKQADEQLDKLASIIVAENPANASTNVTLIPAAEGFTHDVDNAHDVSKARTPLNLLLATAGLVLLIACANLANLLMARGTARSREFAVRLALGASRGRMIRNLMTESLTLSLVGGGCGVLVAIWLTKELQHYWPASASFHLSVTPDPRLMFFAFGVSVLTGILFGLVPAWRASRPQLIPELKSVTGATGNADRKLSLRNGLVVTQVALSLMVLVCAGLCIRSLAMLRQVDPGFEPSKVVMMSFDLDLINYSETRSKQFSASLLERVRALPGVEASSLAWVTPLTGQTPGMSLDHLDDYEQPVDARGNVQNASADINFVSSDYFRTLGIPVLKGREFTSSDTATSQKVALVDDAFVRRYWPTSENPIGRRLFLNNPKGEPIPVQVVGVVKSIHTGSLASTPRRTMYFPETQQPSKQFTLAVRTGIDPGATIQMLRETVKNLDANVPVFGLHTLEQQKTDSLWLERMAAAVLAAFGILALLLAAVGIYGVLAFSVGKRTREIGVRMALGAQVVDVLSMVLRQGLGVVLVGIVVGLAGTFAITRALKSFLFEITPLDPVTFGFVILLLAVAASLACWLPARKAARVDPMEALRNE